MSDFRLNIVKSVINDCSNQLRSNSFFVHVTIDCLSIIYKESSIVTLFQDKLIKRVRF